MFPHLNCLPIGRHVSLFTLSAALLCACTTIQPPADGLVVADHLNGPQGVYVKTDGTLLITDTGTGGTLGTFTTPGGPGSPAPESNTYGNTATIVEISTTGARTVLASLPSVAGKTETSGAGRVTELNGHVYATTGHWSAGASIGQLSHTAVLVQLGPGTVSDLANLWTFEATNDPDKQGADSHPYALVAGPDGNLWMTDAGGNDLLRVNPTTGAVSLVTVFANLPNANPAAGTPPTSQAVPTGVAFLNDGSAYVSLLPGFPFVPGASKVVRVAGDGSQTDYATGLSATTDLRTGPDGNLYAVELGRFGAQGPLPGTGSIVRIRAGGVKETVLSGLNTPTSIAFNTLGDAFVTVNGAAAPGTGQVLRWDRLTSRRALQ